MYTMDEWVVWLKNQYTARCRWWKNREIRLFWEPDIENSTVAVVMDEIHKLCQTIGISFNLIPYGSHRSAMLQMQSVVRGGQIDYNKLFTMAHGEDWRNENIGGREHGDIFISSRHLLNDTVSFGVASHQNGCILLSLHGNTQYHHPLVRRLARHEATHLLGLMVHCDKFPVNGYGEHHRWCNMHYQLPSGETCPKCMAFMRHFWRHHRI